ncbi:MAG: primosomal protein N', partial [Lachnospiraceae bacterium]|nr:primosomal protein N' [Lachnospiraceae bacterium]
SIADDFCGEYDSGIRNTYLIHGITGSGKTEVYMEMISHVVSKGRQVIVLIPEISLTYQTVMRFYKRFGDRVSTLHSRLSDGERYDQFERARKHEIDIMIGPRSALFTPFDDLGLIVIDEEHEHTYKSDQMPKYHAKEVATELAKLHDASVVLGSATPSVGSYNAALSGKYKLYTLTERAQGALLPDVVSVDLRDELKSGNRSIFSSKLREAVGERLRRGEQVMLFLNRRGYAGFVSCRSCGTVVKCPHCDVSLSKHRNGKLVCHYCGYEQGTVKVCGKCGSKMIGQMGIGTEAVEEQIKELFPYASVLRMDADTTKQKGDYESILSTFANREADILVGTQMIVKGHDFPYVTLVGILAADMSLNANDYRAGERTFQLLVQAAGRAGRADRPGEVIIQTYRPEHYAIQAAMKQDYRAFYDEEMIYRAALSYPPCGHMLALITESMDETEGVNFADALARTIADGIIGRAVMIGPTAASIGRIKDVYRRMIYVKSADTAVLTGVKDAAEAFFDRCGNKGLRISFDLDPMNGY